MRRRFVSDQELSHYRVHFLEALQEDGVVCLECRAVRRALGTHVRQHGLTLDDYREKWGYNRGTALATPAIREKKRQEALARNLGALAPAEALPKAQAVRRWFVPPRRLESRFAQRAAALARFAAGAHPANLKATDDTLRQLVAAGLSRQEISAQVGLDHSQVCRRIRALGLVGPAVRPSQLKATDADLLALRDRGLWPAEIARRIGMKRTSVLARLRRLRRRGQPMRTPATPVPSAWRRVSDADLLTLHQAGRRPAEIAARVGITPGAVNWRLRALRRRGVLPANPPPAASRPRRESEVAARVLSRDE
jgi:DNA-binding CsgD family transcriptional regulator